MEEIHKKDYNALKICANVKREELETKKQRGTDLIEQDEEERLVGEGCINWDPESNDLYHPEFILTEKGNKYLLELSEIWRKDWTLLATILSIISTFISLYVLAKTQGWF